MIDKIGITLFRFDNKEIMDSIESKLKDLSVSVSFDLVQEKTINQNLKSYNIARNEKIKFDALKEKCIELGLDDFTQIKQKKNTLYFEY